MVLVLSVAEKPSVAKEISQLLSRSFSTPLQRRNGFSPYNAVYELSQLRFHQFADARMHFTSVSGHLMELEFDAAYKSWSSCAPVDLFTAPVKKSVKKDNEEIQKTLQAEARRAQVLCLWLDCDLEGENIAFEVMQVCLEANPRLDIYRARFSAIIERDILRTMAQPDRPNPHMNDAVEARQEIDLRIGAAFTRFQTLRLQRRFEAISHSVISYGPCQFPTLGFVVERNLAIQAFVPEKFWFLTCEVEWPSEHQDLSPTNDPTAIAAPSAPRPPHQQDPRRRQSVCAFHWQRHRLYDRFTCLVLYERCLDANGRATVVHS